MALAQAMTPKGHLVNIGPRYRSDVDVDAFFQFAGGKHDSIADSSRGLLFTNTSCRFKRKVHSFNSSIIH